MDEIKALRIELLKTQRAYLVQQKQLADFQLEKLDHLLMELKTEPSYVNDATVNHE